MNVACAIYILCVCVSLAVSFWMLERIFIKFGMYIMAPEPISTAYLINPSHQSVCLYNVSHLSLLGNGSIKTFPQQRIHQTKKNCWTRHSPCGLSLIKWESVGLFVCSPIVARQRLGGSLGKEELLKASQFFPEFLVFSHHFQFTIIQSFDAM
jgi:hypothetical protein